MNEFKDKVVIITGGSSGIGKATALRFSKLGAKVVVVSRNKVEGEGVRDLIITEGGSASFVKTDVTLEHEVRSMVEKTVERYGQIDIAINNAGVDEDPGPVAFQTEVAYNKIMDVNVKGIWLCMKYQLPELQKSKGCVVNMSSMAGLVGFAGAPLYTASKHAVIGMTKSFALEYAPLNVRINAIAPGSVDAGMLHRVADNEEIKEMIKQMHPMKRLATVTEIAESIIYLCSAAAGFMTGNTLTVDGGYTAA